MTGAVDAIGVRLKTEVLGGLRWALGRRGYDITSDRQYPPDYDQGMIEVFQAAKPYTLTSHERVFALRQAVQYVTNSQIPGAIVECGVWRGGSMFVIAKTLVELGVSDRDLYLFDTFESMPPPGEHDVDVWGTHAGEFFDAAVASPVYAYLPQDQVQELLTSTGYPVERIHFVRGMVEDTLPDAAPAEIALCRLDTDWYVSTAHEMRHLFPLINEGGIVIIDDYGHFMGAKQAVDEYLRSKGIPLLLNRIDSTGRLAVVTGQARAAACADAAPGTGTGAG